MNQIALCDWLPERATWSYLARSGLAAVSREKKIPREPNNKSHIDLAFSVNMARYWPLLFASLWTTQKRTWPISSHLDRKSLVNNPYICCIFVHPALDSAPLFVGIAGKSIHSDAHTASISQRRVFWSI